MTSNQSILTGLATLHAEVSGNGDPVVFLHAAVGDTRMWSAQLAGLGVIPIPRW